MIESANQKLVKCCSVGEKACFRLKTARTTRIPI